MTCLGGVVETIFTDLRSISCFLRTGASLSRSVTFVNMRFA